MPTQRLFVLLARAGIVLGGGACAVFMIGPFQGLERALVPWDKAAHFIAFYGVTLLLYLSFPSLRRMDLTLLAVFAGCAVEGLQHLSGRDAGLGDMAANACGALAVFLPMQVESLRAAARGTLPTDRRRPGRFGAAAEAGRSTASRALRTGKSLLGPARLARPRKS